MGNRKRLALASLVSILMMLSFAIGLVPSQWSGAPSSATAAQGATEVAISADGITPTGDNFSIPVGSEQSFTALSITNGAATHLIPTGEAEWSLATDGAAALTAVEGDFVAAVSALAPGEAGLYVSTGNGLVDLVNLTLYSLKAAKVVYDPLTSVTITQPKDGRRIFVQSPAPGFVSYTLTAQTDSPINTANVAYSDNTTKVELGSASVAPYAVAIPDVSAWAPTATITAVATSILKYQVTDQSTVSVFAVNADSNGDGLPDDPFSLGLGEGDEWVSNVTVEGGLRQVNVKGLGAGKSVPIPVGGVSTTIADPNNPARSFTVTVPPNLLTAGESGLLVVVVADTLGTLLGLSEAGDVGVEPAGGLVGSARYVEISILISPDGGLTYAEIDDSRLTATPVTLEMQGLTVLAGENAGYFAYPTNFAGAPIITLDAISGSAWAPTSGGSVVENGKMSAELSSLSIFAPYNTPTNIQIVSVTNTATGLPSDYSIGGGTLDIVVNNLPGSVIVTIDGNVATQANVSGNVVTVAAPPANPLAAPAASAPVNVRVEDAADANSFDERLNGLTYLGPTITGINPATGSDAGGTPISVTGEGFALGLSANLGGAAITAVSVGSSTLFTGVTGAHSPGVVDINVALVNNYIGSASGLFEYTAAPPQLDSVFPESVLTDGGYTVRANGSGFFTPTKTVGANRGFFAAAPGVANPGVDPAAIEVEFLDDTKLNLVTPEYTTPQLTSVYVAGEVYNNGKALFPSNLKDFRFLDAVGQTITINGIYPGEGRARGGNEVAIVGENFPVSDGSPPPDITSGTVLRVDRLASTGPIANIPVSLFRGADALAGLAASTIDGTFVFDTAVLTPRSNTLVDPAFVASADLSAWYGKSAAASIGAGTIDVVISGGTTAITTFDDQRFGGTPTNQQNPFPLGFMRCNVVGVAGTRTTIQVQGLSMADPAATPLTNAVGQSGYLFVGAAIPPPTPVVPKVYFGINEAVVSTVKTASTASTLYVTAPAAERLGISTRVDVRVEDSANASSIAISRANATYTGTPAGYLYNANSVPVAQDQSVSTPQDTALPITLAATDADGDPLTYSIVSQPLRGTVAKTGQNVTYTPTAGYSGPDSFTFKANDGIVDSNVATVSITVTPVIVNNPPLAISKTVSTSKNAPLDITLDASDADNDPLTFNITVQPVNGTLAKIGPVVRYTPNLDYVGPDSFKFTANDGQVDSNEAAITINVNAVNEAPTAFDLNEVTNQNTPKQITLLATDPNPGDVLTFSITVQPVNGTLAKIGPVVTYTPATDYFGPDSFKYAASDGQLISNEATVSITVNQVVDPVVTSLDPASSWVFGGTVAHITGQSFAGNAEVRFGGVLAVNAAGKTNSATNLHVIVPPLPSVPNDLSTPSTQVPVTVTNPGNSNVATAPNAFTYVIFDDGATVKTTAFYFDRATGTATARKIKLDATAGQIEVPALSGVKLVSSTVFALVRATKDPSLFGIGGAVLSGTAVPNIWNFDIHLYDGSSPFTELNPQLTPGETPITLTYPTDGTSLNATADAGRMSTFSIDSTFEYGVPPVGAFTPVPDPDIYQSNVIPAEFVSIVGGDITQVTSRLYHLSALALRKGIAPPVIEAILDSPAGEAEQGDEIDLSGKGLGWIRSISIVDGADNVKAVTVVGPGTITSDEFGVNFTFPRVVIQGNANEQIPVGIKVVVNDGTPAGRTLPVIPGLTVKATPADNLLGIILAALAALLGLAAGGDSGGGGGGPCFIATAAYGTPMAAEIDTLRALRDTYLLNNAAGTAFVDLYYHLSPGIADVVAKSPALAAAVRLALTPVILMAKLLLAVPQVTVLLSLMAGATLYLRRRKAKKA